MPEIIHIGTAFAGNGAGGLALDLTEHTKGRPIKSIKSADAVLFATDGGANPAVQYPITVVAVTPSGAEEIQLTGANEVTYQCTSSFTDWMLVLDVEYLYPRAGEQLRAN